MGKVWWDLPGLVGHRRLPGPGTGPAAACGGPGDVPAREAAAGLQRQPVARLLHTSPALAAAARGARAACPETARLRMSLLHTVLPGTPPPGLFERLKAFLIWPQCRSILEINEKGEKKKLSFNFY